MPRRAEEPEPGALRRRLGHRLLGRRPRPRAEPEAEFHHHRHRTLGLRRRRQRELDVDLDLRAPRIVDVAHQPLGDDRDAVDLLLLRLGNFPLHLGYVFGDAAVDLAVEVLDDLRPAPGPPLVGGGDLCPILADERVGERERLDLRLVVVGKVRRTAIHPFGTLAERFDPQCLHHQLVVPLAGHLDGVRVGRLRDLPDFAGFASCAKAGTASMSMNMNRRLARMALGIGGVPGQKVEEREQRWSIHESQAKCSTLQRCVPTGVTPGSPCGLPP